MVIVIDKRFPSARPGGFEIYVQLLLEKMAQQYQDYHFVVLDRKESKSNTGEKLTRDVTPLPASGLARWWWQRTGLPAFLRRHKASIYISCNGLRAEKSRIPQLLLTSGPGWTSGKGTTRRLRAQAGRWMTVTEFGRDQWMEQHPSFKDGRVAGIAVRPAFQPLEWEEKAAVREQYTSGTEYFLCTGAFLPRKNLFHLLKAFSFFKKRQQSSFKLLLAGDVEDDYTAFGPALKTYKYRSDVIVAGYLDGPELARVTAAAYAIVYPSFYEEIATPVAEAMQAGTPVIAAEGTATTEIAGDAALYADPHEPSSIADQMMLLYKDERLRAKMIAAGLEKAASFDIDAAARRLAALITDALH